MFILDENIEKILENSNYAFVIYLNNEFDFGIYIKNLIFTDLTLMFGEGYEPSQGWCDKYLDRYIEYNLEGTLIPIKELGEPIKTSYYDKIDMFD